MAEAIGLVSNILAHPLVDPGTLSAVNRMGGTGDPVDIDITMLVYLAIFFVVWFALKKLLFDPYLRVRDARHRGTGGSRDEAEVLTAKAEGLIAEYKAATDRARQEAAQLRLEQRGEGSAEQKALLAQAYDGAAKIIAEGRANLEGQVDEANREMRREAEKLSELMADRLLPLS